MGFSGIVAAEYLHRTVVYGLLRIEMGMMGFNVGCLWRPLDTSLAPLRNANPGAIQFGAWHSPLFLLGHDEATDKQERSEEFRSVPGKAWSVVMTQIASFDDHTRVLHFPQ